MHRMAAGVVAMIVALAAGMAFGSEGGHHGGTGGNGGTGGTGSNGGTHGTPTVSAPVAAPGFSDSGVAPVTVVGSAPGHAQDKTLADAAACAQPFATLIRANTDGSFTYGGLEYETPKFAQCMKAKGYRMGTPGEPSTNFGTR